MITLWLSLTLLGLLGLAFLFIPLKNATQLTEELNQQANSRQLANLNLYQQKLAQLEASLQAGELSQEIYQELVTEAEDLLIDDAALQETKPWHLTSRATNLGVLAVVGVATLVAAFLTYNQLGAKDKLAARLIQDELIAEGREDFGALLARFEQAVKNNPNDSQGWGLLAQIYIDSGELAKAAAAISQINRIEGPIAALYAQEAQALYFANQGQLTPKVSELLKLAFELDPKDPLALSLKGALAYQVEDWETARLAWEAALPFASSINAEGQLLEGIADVRSRLNMPQLTGEGPSLVIQLSLSNAAQLLSHPEATVFLFASLPEGGAPLAATRLKAKDLPTSITLSNQHAMQPNHNLSSAKEVLVTARLSASGSTTPSEGDWQGSSQLIPLEGRTQLSIEINQQF